VKRITISDIVVKFGRIKKRTVVYLFLVKRRYHWSFLTLGWGRFCRTVAAATWHSLSALHTFPLQCRVWDVTSAERPDTLVVAVTVCPPDGGFCETGTCSGEMSRDLMTVDGVWIANRIY
jgi:hypothetical protein